MKSVNQIIVGLESEAEHAEVMSKTPGWSALAGTYREEASLLREAIAKLREYQALQSSDTSARLAAIKDIPTERVIALAQAEAAGLVSISASAAEGANAQPNEPLTKGCDECEFCRPVCAQDGFSFLGCHYEPYRGKWVREIKTCPRPPKEAET